MKKKFKIFTILAMLSCLLLALFTGCGNQATDDTKKKVEGPSGKLMIYTSIYPDIIQSVKPALKKAFPNLEIEWFQGGTEKVVTKLTGEIEANKIGADLLMVADPSYYLTLEDQYLLLKYDAPNRKDVESKDAEGYWTGVRISNMIIAYNTNKVKEEDAPKSFKDLLDPKWKDKIAMPNPLLSGTAFVTTAALSDAFGWDYFEKLKANGLKVEDGNSKVQNKLITGEYDVGIILEENILKMAAKGEPLKVVYPEDGVVVVPSPISIFKTSQNIEAAKAVENWWLSKEGQEAIVKGWMHSVRKDVTPPKGAPEFSTFSGRAFKVNWAKIANDNETIKETFRNKVMDN
ncbi:ABC transporter substrate-binding protein [Clostridium ganghwense]|uniref:ABC transporter substrate-binding protein n=1 Tax=Clostridium ganghwense TaxID=312089 RepID=A0ABT4CLL0_9CLOT|nr:ABC transporter substrate-binding protein [Clostridium ganghwense]MCY6369131.1 ABC transporter substrate-binding protein [Clostridium ganghwense]